LDILNGINAFLLGQVHQVEYGVSRYVLFGLPGLAVLVGIVFFVRYILNRTHYELDGSYGGGPGLRRFFRHKRLKRYDREGELRGKAQSFKDLELEKLLYEDKLSEAARYLTGILTAAKEAGDDYTRICYAKYSEEIISRYDKLEEDAKGGKALHVKK
jgi:hypothetical protein